MNIFVTSKCPYESAKYLDNKRCVKMVLESAQLLSSAIAINGEESPYKLTHRNHPCTRFAATSRCNYKWLLRHFIALCREYTRRFGKTHKSQSLILKLYGGMHCIPDKGFTGFVNCASNRKLEIDFTHINDVPQAYRLYLRRRQNLDLAMTN